ncbi:hypothetical protein [Hyalangium rubrum]|uniref:Uncharacterized protein n=1 Tax=Hyalangium rubrum TaxID=3103134 RepID=A0ABU5H9N3_9BACT|nr:hypothetical protein [Hyalangium sp. s54d21]MDY7230183.1 hypothetical protein [Hyalangium sp. s54d21]
MSDQLEEMNRRIRSFEEALAEGDGRVDFAEQLRVGQGLAGAVEDARDFALIRQLFDQASPHMRRLGSLALEAIAHRWYADAAPLALRHLDDGFDWVEYDCVRFFLNQAPLDAATLQRLDDKLARTQNASISKIATPGLLALRALAASYAVPLHVVEAQGFRFQLPETWQLTREVADAVTFAAPAIDWLEQSKNPCRNQFLLQVVRDVDPAELEELAEVNLQGFGVETPIDHPALARSASARAMRYGTRETYPTVRIREVRTYGTTLLCIDTQSPLAHLEHTLARNLAILDSVQPL